MRWRWGAALVTAGTLFVGCGGSGTLVDLAAGRWSCTVQDLSAQELGSFDAAVEISRDHTWSINVVPEDGSDDVELDGTWRLAGDSATALVRIAVGKASDVRPMRFDGASEDSHAVAVFANRVHESDFAVERTGDDHVVFRQTQSGGRHSEVGGDADAWVASCRKG